MTAIDVPKPERGPRSEIPNGRRRRVWDPLLPTLAALALDRFPSWLCTCCNGNGCGRWPPSLLLLPSSSNYIFLRPEAISMRWMSPGHRIYATHFGLSGQRIHPLIIASTEFRHGPPLPRVQAIEVLGSRTSCRKRAARSPTVAFAMAETGRYALMAHPGRRATQLLCHDRR